MALSAPNYYGAISNGTLTANQAAQNITPADAAINAKLKALPQYQAYISTLQSGGTAFQRKQAADALTKAAEPLGIPDNAILDPYTGQVREKSWNERNSNWSALLYSGAAVGAGLTLGATTAALTAPATLPAVAGGGAATTAAVVPPALAATATGGPVAGVTSWLTSPTASLIGKGADIAGQIWSTNKQVDANADAAKIQAAEYDKALAQQQAELDYQHQQDTYKKGQFGDYLSRLDPYARTGQAANNTLAQWMGQPPQAQTPVPAPSTAVSPLIATSAGISGGGGTNTSGSAQTDQMVRLRAPDGTEKDVPAAQVAYYLSKGAKTVGNGFGPTPAPNPAVTIQPTGAPTNG